MTEPIEQAKILIVDDTPENIDVLGAILKPHYKRSVALSGEKALQIANSKNPPDLILLDIMMPEMDGYEVCRRLKANEATRDIPVIFVTAKSEVEDETKGFEVGGVDYIVKPISPPIVLARVRTHLELTQARKFLKNQNEILEQKVRERTRELALTQDVTILSLASLAETRDNETGGHIRRTQNYIKALAEQLMTNPKYQAVLDEQSVEIIYKSAPLHDVGKVGVPDRILLKAGKLTDEEFAEMKKHAALGRDAILNAEKGFGEHAVSSFLRFAREISHTHHEKWDGTGYPHGLAGEEIPLAGRLMAVADVYDALISRRVYKQPFSHDKAAGIIIEGRGAHFDPDVVDAFRACEHRFREIAMEYADHDEKSRDRED
ncbi:MAG: two-component system response regulator [Pseudomonadota bacterium]